MTQPVLKYFQLCLRILLLVLVDGTNRIRAVLRTGHDGYIRGKTSVILGDGEGLCTNVVRLYLRKSTCCNSLNPTSPS